MTDAKIRISADALALARYHPLAEDMDFLVAQSEGLARLHSSAPLSERLATLNKTTAEHHQRLDAEARAAERGRIRAILKSPEAEGRRTAAEALAFEGDAPAETAVAALRGLPRDSSPANPPLAPTSEVEAALKARDEGRGLLTAGGEYATIASDPTPPQKPGGDKAKVMWRGVIAEINRESAAGAKVTGPKAAAG